jgi:hypothetical protein
VTHLHVVSTLLLATIETGREARHRKSFQYAQGAFR